MTETPIQELGQAFHYVAVSGDQASQIFDRLAEILKDSPDLAKAFQDASEAVSGR